MPAVPASPDVPRPHGRNPGSKGFLSPSSTPALAVLRLLTFTLLALVLAQPLPASSATLVPTAATWRWRPGTNEASTPTTAWRNPGFADTAFTPAPAPFWYGDPLPGGTQIQGMRNVYASIFLRTTFVIDDPASLGALRLEALVDDGFVAWINGTEVLRVNMPGIPGSAVTVTTLANNAAEPVTFAEYPLPSPATYLRSGTNVLAVQVFQSSLSSSDLGFDAALHAVIRETIPPTVTATTPAPNDTVTQLTELTVTFSEPVAGVTAAHLRVNGIGATGVTPVNPSSYRYSFPQPAYGTVSIDWHPAQTITDLAEPPNPFNPDSPGARFNLTLVDRSPPSVAALSPAASRTVRSLDSIRVLFTEPVAGMDAADLLINGQAATGMESLADTEFAFTFPPPPTGAVNVAWRPNHGITDRADPPNAFEGGSWSYQLDPDAEEHPPYISEFMASNTRVLRDDLGGFSDWIELHNPSPAVFSLEGWYLTDATNNLRKWRFPATNVPPHGFLIVFASGEDRRSPGAPLHTSFALSTSGEYLALVRPDGTTPVSEFRPAFPQQVPDVSHGVAQIQRGEAWERGPDGVYFTQPTPGAPNTGGSTVPGPILASVQHAPNVPLDDEDLRVTARVLPAFAPVATVRLHYRIQFGAETTVPMLDDGTQGDGSAGDGVFGAIIPANLSTNGQMIRYYLTATDTAGSTSRWPLYPNPSTSEQYLGTVVNPGHVISKLPIFHLFVAPNQMAGIDSESGGRVAFFYDGEFYDNVYMELRGNTSAGLNKKSHRIEFLRGRELRHAGPGGRTRRSSLLAEHLDPTFLRQHLCFWFLGNIGVPSPYHYPVRVQMNGQFYQLAFHNDVIGSEQVERLGYDPSGALYKAVGNLVPNFSSTGVFQKLEPEGDPSRADYLQLANGINEAAPLNTRRATVFDLLDVPQVINHLAGTRWCAENDDVWANMSLYRDTHGDGLWRNIPFDMNASWGQLYGGSSPLEATVDSSKSHPLYGGSSTEGNFNRLYDVIVRLPETRQMLLRRQRSILDRWVQPPETPLDSRILENYVRQMTNLIAAEAQIDRAKWGFSPWAPNKTFAAGVNDLINQFIIPRRRHWYVTHSITNTARPIGINNSSNAGIPLSQPADARLVFADLDFNPASGIQAQEFVALRNPLPYAVDVSGWSIDGAIRFTFRPGTVVPTNSLVFVSPDVRQFRARTSGPRGGQGLFVVGPSSGQLSARGESLVLRNDRGVTVANFTYPGDPSPAQRFLRISELYYHPSNLLGSFHPADAFEFVELVNTSTNTPLDLAGIRFVTGIQFDFSTSSIPRLNPGARLLVVANPAAFTTRFGSNLPVAGTYTGQLDNGGERLRLVDAANEEILDFEYSDNWHPSTDGFGFSLVTANELANPGAWSQPSHWKPSAHQNGSPGTAEPPPQPPPSAPLIVTQPTDQFLIPGSPAVLSLVVTNTASLPLGIIVHRSTDTSINSPVTSFTTSSHRIFIPISGPDAAPPWSSYTIVVTNQALPIGLPSRPARLHFLPDSDLDGLPDAWEIDAWGDLLALPDTDTDADGLTEHQEFLAGTDPTDPSSRLALQARLSTEGLILGFQAVSNRTYSIQSTPAPGLHPWQTVSDIPAEPANRVLEFALPPADALRAFRLVTPRHP